jgi:pilus assembly protein CpaB
MRAKSMAMLMLALGCGLVASIGITQVMAKRNAEPVSTGETTPIFIAVKDISLGDRLSAEVLKLESWPKDKVPAGAVSKIEDIEGCRTRTKLYAGEPILEKKLLGKGASMQGDSAKIPDGMRAVAVKVDNVSGGPGLIMPGDRVDVLVHLVRNPSLDIQETSTRTILQDIKVFAVNDVVDVGEQKDTKDKEKETAKTISLLVTPAQAADLMLATELGKVRLVMRNADDKGRSLDGSSNPSVLFGEGKKSNRDKESLLKPEAATPPKNTGFANFLEGMKKQLAVKPQAALPSLPLIANETWTMRFLGPNGINEIMLEADPGPQGLKMPQGAWHIASTGANGIGNGAVNPGNSRKATPPPPAPSTNAPPAKHSGPPSAKAAAGSSAEAKSNSTPQESQPADESSDADSSASSAGEPQVE